MASLFFSYSHVDEALRDQLEKQLAMLKRQGVIETWHDRRIDAGQDFGREIDNHVDTDDIILLLVSSDFLASDYCYEREMLRAVARHDAGEAVVIPVILRACDWKEAPFGRLQATPTDGRPITQWPDRDQAFLEVARAIRGAVERLTGKAASPVPSTEQGHPAAPSPGPRSSNLRIAKNFSEREQDAFRVETFEYVARYFENSLAELSARNPGIEGTFRRIDANRFTAAAYRDGKAIARCTVFIGERWSGAGIAYSSSGSGETNSYNESVDVAADDQSMFLKSLGFSFRQGSEHEKLSQEGAAELFWSIFIEPFQS